MITLRSRTRALACVILLSLPQIGLIAAKERTDESKIRSDLQQYGQRLLEIQGDFLDFGKATSGEAQFNLFYVAKEAEVTFLNVYHVRTVLDIAIVAQSETDEPVIRFVLAREAKDLVWAVDQAITSTKKSRSDFAAPLYLKRLDDFSSLLRELRPIAQRLATEKKLGE